MKFNVENLEHNEALITIEVEQEKFEEAIEKAYNNKKGSISIQGFRKGKAPRKIIEKMYGEGVFYEDAANIVIRETYPDAAKDSKLDIVSSPEMDIVKLEKNEPFIYSAKVAVKPEVKLGEYKGIKLEDIVVEVTDEEVETKIKADLEKNARVISVDRAVENGDQAIIDFEGFIDGVAFQGGQGTAFPLMIGSKTFIEGFEEQIIGMNPGEEKTINVTFPEDYQSEELAGKPAEFKVKLQEVKVKEVPELDMEFVEEVSDAESVEAYKEEVKNELFEVRKKEAQTRKENKSVQTVIDNVEIDIPELMIKTNQEDMLNDFSRRISAQGLTLEQYLQFTGQTKEKLAEEMKEQAIKRIKTRLTLEAIVKAENIEATEEELKEKIEEIAKNVNMSLEQVSELLPAEEKEAISLDISVQKAIDLIVNNAIFE